MFEAIIRKAGSIVHSVFIPVVRAAPNESIDIPNEGIIERFKTVFTFPEYGGLSPEIISFIGWFQHGIMFGAPMGAIVHGKNQYMDFMENARASQYKWHWEAKADLSTKMIKGAVKGAYIWTIKSTILASTYGLLVNLIPIVRNEQSWQEYIISAVLTGLLGGHMFSDRKELGFEDVKMTGRLTYRQQSLVKGATWGLAFGMIAALYSLNINSRSTTAELKKWEKYWKQRLKSKNAKDS